MTSPVGFVAAVVVVASFVYSLAEVTVPDIGIRFRECSVGRYGGSNIEGPYLTCTKFVLHEVRVGTAEHGYDYYVSHTEPPNIPCHAHGACNPKLRKEECALCIAWALNIMYKYCEDSDAALANLMDCRVRRGINHFDPHGY